MDLLEQDDRYVRALPNHSFLSRHQYRRPPVVEALIDIHVAFAGAINVPVLRQVWAGDEAQYPTEQQLMATQLTIDVGTGAPTSQTQEVMGYRFISSSQNAVIQARSNGFSFSRLPPYSSWNDWQPEAKRLWDKYREIMNPVAITRIAVRYINRIDIGSTGKHSFSDFLTTYPEIGPGLPQSVTGYIMQLQLPEPEMPGVTLQLGQGRVLNTDDDVASILLDLDLFRVGEIAVQGDEVWHHLKRLHDRENELFEACITDLARETFD